MGLFDSSYLTALCPDKWVAKAYSEYLFSAAANSAELLDNLTSTASDDVLDAAVELASDEINDAYSVIDSAVGKLIAARYGLPSGYSKDSAEYGECLSVILDDPTPEITTAVETLEANSYIASFDDITDALQHGDLNEAIWAASAVQSRLTTLKNAFLSNFSLAANQQISIDSGFISAGSIFDIIIKDINLPNSQPVEVEITDALDNVKTVQLNAEIIFDNIKASLASASAWAAGFASAGLGSLSDVLANFDTTVGQIVGATSEKFASSVATVKSVLASVKGDVRGFFATADEMLGFKKIADDVYTSPDDTDVYDFTGASPFSVTSIKAAGGIIAAAGKLIVAAFAGTFEACKTILSKIWNKVRPYIKALTSNPEDIEVVNKDDESYGVDNFMYNVSGLSMIFTMHRPEAITDLTVGAKLKSAMNSSMNEWIAIDTYFAEVLFRITSLFVPTTGGNIEITFDLKFRPKCMNYSALCDAGLFEYSDQNGYIASKILSGTTVSDWIKFVSTNSIYADDDASEEAKYAGFVCGLFGLFTALHTCFGRFNSLSNFESTFNWRVGSTVYDRDGNEYNFTTTEIFRGTLQNGLPTNVTNLDFVQLVSGYQSGQSDAFSFTQVPLYLHDSTPTRMPIEIFIGPLIAIYMIQQYEKYRSPSDYSFLPYCKGTTDFSPGRYHIRSDTANTNIANILGTIVIVVVIVAATIFIAKGISKVLKNAKRAKWARVQGMYDNAMWNGQKLSAGQAWKYSRAMAKQDKINGASSGLVGSASATSDILSKLKTLSVSATQDTNGSETLSQIYSIITGL